jgi:hypothetical protein
MTTEEALVVLAAYPRGVWSSRIVAWMDAHDKLVREADEILRRREDELDGKK